MTFRRRVVTLPSPSLETPCLCSPDRVEPRSQTTSSSLTSPTNSEYILRRAGHALLTLMRVGSGGRAVECRTVNREDCGSIPSTAVSKLSQFHSPHVCLCLSEETLKAGGPFYLVSMPGEVKDPIQGVNV